MATFWDEIQKQYQNSEQRYRDAINTGVSMLTNKFNMLNSMQNNEQNMINNLIGIQQGQNNQNLGMFGTMLNKESADRTFAENVRQFDRDYNLREKQVSSEDAYRTKSLALDQLRTNADIQYRNDVFALDKKLKEKEISLADYQLTKTKLDNQYNMDIILSENPQAVTRLAELSKKYPSASKDWLYEKIAGEGLMGKFGKAKTDNDIMSGISKKWSEVTGVKPNQADVSNLPSWMYGKKAKEFINNQEVSYGL